MDKRNLLKKIWEPEDSRTFGELALIFGAILLTTAANYFLPQISPWLYLAIGFLVVLFGVKLLRKAEKDDRKPKNTKN